MVLWVLWVMWVAEGQSLQKDCLVWYLKCFPGFGIDSVGRVLAPHNQLLVSMGNQ